jgi:superfamily I DNA/RNA helicase
MARAYDGRGLTAFTLAMRRNWDDTEAQVEGRPDAEADSVSIITMHLAKGLEWPIVIPINSPTELYDDTTFLHRRSDDTVHFKILDEAPAEYELVKAAERDQVRRERVRLWYVAITRACDLLPFCPLANSQPKLERSMLTWAGQPQTPERRGVGPQLVALLGWCLPRQCTHHRIRRAGCYSCFVGQVSLDCSCGPDRNSGSRAIP